MSKGNLVTATAQASTPNGRNQKPSEYPILAKEMACGSCADDSNNKAFSPKQDVRLFCVSKKKILSTIHVVSQNGTAGAPSQAYRFPRGVMLVEC